MISRLNFKKKKKKDRSYFTKSLNERARNISQTFFETLFICDTHLLLSRTFRWLLGKKKEKKKLFWNEEWKITLEGEIFTIDDGKERYNTRDLSWKMEDSFSIL